MVCKRTAVGYTANTLMTARAMYGMIKEIEQLPDTRNEIKQGAFVVEIKKQEKGSRIHKTDCHFIELLLTRFGAGKEHKREAGTRYFHSRYLKEARLFWTFERLEPDILPCERCKPCGTEAPAIPDGDHELYDWLRSMEGQITNVDELTRKVLDAYKEKRPREEMMFQAEVTRDLAENGFTVLAVECTNKDERTDVDARLAAECVRSSGRADVVPDEGLNIQAWRGKFSPDYDMDEQMEEHGTGSVVYDWDEVSANTVKKKLTQLPDNGVGMVVNRMPGRTYANPPMDEAYTANKCLIMANDRDEASIYGLPEFKPYLPLANRVCKALGCRPVEKLGVWGADIEAVAGDVVVVSDSASWDYE